MAQSRTAAVDGFQFLWVGLESRSNSCAATSCTPEVNITHDTEPDRRGCSRKPRGRFTAANEYGIVIRLRMCRASSSNSAQSSHIANPSAVPDPLHVVPTSALFRSQYFHRISSDLFDPIAVVRLFREDPTDQIPNQLIRDIYGNKERCTVSHL